MENRVCVETGSGSNTKTSPANEGDATEVGTGKGAGPRLGATRRSAGGLRAPGRYKRGSGGAARQTKEYVGKFGPDSGEPRTNNHQTLASSRGHTWGRGPRIANIGGAVLPDRCRRQKPGGPTAIDW